MIKIKFSSIFISLFILLNFVSVLSSCVEPVFSENCLLDNDDAEIYVLNFSDSDIFIEIHYADNKYESKKIPVSEDCLKKRSELDRFSRDEFLYFSVVNEIDSKKNKSEMPFARYCDFTGKVSENDRIFSSSELANVYSIVLNKNENALYSSEIHVLNENPLIVIENNPIAGYYVQNLFDVFSSGAFIFKSQPGDYLFIESDIDFSYKTDEQDGLLKNLKYIIVIL